MVVVAAVVVVVVVVGMIRLGSGLGFCLGWIGLRWIDCGLGNVRGCGCGCCCGWFDLAWFGFGLGQRWVVVVLVLVVVIVVFVLVDGLSWFGSKYVLLGWYGWVECGFGCDRGCGCGCGSGCWFELVGFRYCFVGLD